ncbi:putative ribonuclease H-like domain-containing protein [Tanacetum coccineum]
MRPFGCPVTILNTLDPLGKFDEKADEGFFVGYSINSKAFRVFNTRTRKVEENMHINFLENKPNVAKSGPKWLFDIDLLTNSMNYEPVTAGNQTNKNACIKDNVDAVPTQQYILLPLLYDSLQSSKDAVADDAGKKTNEEPANEGERNGYANSTNRDRTVSPSISTAGQNFSNADDLPTDPLIPDLEDIGIFSGAYDDEDVGAEADLNNLETTMNISPIPTTRIHKDHPKDQIIGDINSATQTKRMTKISEEHAMTLLDLPKGKRAIGTKWVYRNKKGERGIVVRNKARLVAQGYTQEEGIDYDKVFAYVARIEAIKLFFAYASFMGLIMYQMDVKSAFLYGTIEEEISSIGELTFLLGLQDIQKDDGIFISQDKYVADILKKFDFVTVKTTSTPIETNKVLLKDKEAEDVDVHLYRSMIGSLMYLTASRPDIMFPVCACSRFQVTPKVSHLHVVKRIFRYLKGSGPRCQDTILGVQKLKLGLRLHLNKSNDPPLSKVNTLRSMEDSIKLKELMELYKVNWRGKEMRDTVRLKIERELMIITIDDGNAFWKEIGVNAGVLKLMLLSLKLNAAKLKSDLKLDDVEGTNCLPIATIFAELERTGAKTTSWNEFSSTMASAIICLSTNQKFNLSKYIFNNMMKNLDGGVKFLMYPRFVQVFLDKKVEGMSKHKGVYVTPSHTKKVFANMKRPCKGFSGRVIPLFSTMMV